MALPVIVKSTKRGMQLVLDPNIPFEELLDKIRDKFQTSKEFFQNTKVALNLSERVLSYEEEYQIIELLRELCQMEVICILEEHELLDDYISEKLQLLAQERQRKCGYFHKGDIKSGQILESSHSIVILGNVLAGGKVLSKGNIVILGSLKGYAYAGVSGKQNAFISATYIDTDKIRIADEVIPKKRFTLGLCKKTTVNAPQIAYAKDKTIVIEPLTSGYLNEI